MPSTNNEEKWRFDINNVYVDSIIEIRMTNKNVHDSIINFIIKFEKC